jgi:hypothetical protein
VDGVSEVAEHEGGDHPSEIDTRRERDQVPVGERERRAHEPECGRRAEGKAAAREQHEHQEHRRRNGEPQRRLRRVLCVLPDGELERGDERHQDDQGVEPVRASEVSAPTHGLNVLQGRFGGLIRR